MADQLATGSSHLPGQFQGVPQPGYDAEEFSKLCDALLAMEDEEGPLFGLSCPQDVPPTLPLPLTAAETVALDEAVLAHSSPSMDLRPFSMGASPPHMMETGATGSGMRAEEEGLSWLEPISDYCIVSALDSSTLSSSPGACPSVEKTSFTHSPRSVKRARGSSSSGGVDQSSEEGTTSRVDLMPSADIEEQRRQKRMAKNRRTAAESRERKKAAQMEITRELEALRSENLRLKCALATQESRTKFLEGELASLSRGASDWGAPSTKAAVVHNTEPAEPDYTPPSSPPTTTTITLSPVRQQQQRWTSPTSKDFQELSSAWLVLSCLAFTCQAASKTLEHAVLLAVNNASLRLSQSPAPLSAPAGL